MDMNLSTPEVGPANVADHHPMEEENPGNITTTHDLDVPSMVTLASSPMVEPTLGTSVVLSGTAIEGVRAGPQMGLVDITNSKHAYFFRVSLPSIKREQYKLSCEIELGGMVLIRGETSVSKLSRGFEMVTHRFCSPGPFQISFKLPGLVDPKLITFNFRDDGILEGVAIKYKLTSAPVDWFFGPLNELSAPRTS